MEAETIEKALEEGHWVQFKPTGGSMSPLFASGRDVATVAPIGDRKIKRGDIVLYRRRESDILVLHRVYRGAESAYYMLGDNQTEIEGPVERDDIFGIMVYMMRKGKKLSMSNFFYRAVAWMWLLLRPVRPQIMGVVNAFIGLKKRQRR